MTKIAVGLSFLILDQLASGKKSTARQLWYSTGQLHAFTTVKTECGRLVRRGLVQTEIMLISINGSSKTYSITDRGRDILEEYKAGE